MTPHERLRTVGLLLSISVLASCNSGGSSSGSQSAAPQDTIAPTNVQNFAATAENQAATLTWDDATDNEAITGYRIWIVSPPSSSGSATPITRIVGPSPTRATWPNLRSGVTYTFGIVAIDASNNLSPNPAFVTVLPLAPDVTPPEEVTGLVASGTRVSGVVEIRLAWVASISPDVSHYLLCLGTANGSCDLLSETNIGNITQIVIPDPSGPITAADLPQPFEVDQQYFVRITAVDSSGNRSGAVSTSVTPTLSTDITPPAPVEIVAARPDDGAVTLEWVPQDADAVQFSIYYRNISIDPGRESEPWTFFATRTGTSATVTGLSNGVTYEFMVAGLDLAGNETPGAETSETADDEAAKVTAIPTSNLIYAEPNFRGGVFREEFFDPPREVVVMVAARLPGLLTSDAGTQLFYTLDGSTIDTTTPTSDATHGFVSFDDPALVTEVVPERLYAVRIDFDPSVAGVQSISENTLRPNGGADHIVLHYLVRTPTDASRVFEENYLIYAGHAPSSFLKFSGTRFARGFATLTPILDGGTHGDLILIGGSSGAGAPIANVCESLITPLWDTGSRYRAQFEHFESFQPTALNDNMSMARVFHRATLLGVDNESVLVTGGFNPIGRTTPGDGVSNRSLGLRTTEIFRANPNSDGFEGASDLMDQPRSHHTATRLYDGRVLILGGLTGDQNLVGSFAAPEEIVATPGRNDPTNAVLSFEAAGTTYPDLAGRVVEKFNPAGDVCEVGVIISSAPNRTNGDIIDLMVEGIPNPNVPGDEFRVINAGTRTGELFAANGTNGAAIGDSMLVERYGHSATLLSDGTVFVCGGIYDYRTDSDKPTADGLNEFLTEIYDPQINSFVPLGEAAQLPDTRFFHTATLLRDGKVLICGGVNRGDYVYRTTSFAGGASVRNSAVLFDPFNRTIKRLDARMKMPRFFHASTLLPNGEVLIAGGYTAVDEDGTLTITKSAEIYDPVTQTFRETNGDMLTYRGPLAAALIPDVESTALGGQVLIAGGAANTLAEVFNPATGRFTATAHGMTYDRYVGAEHATLFDGRVLITGGQESTLFGRPGEFLDSVELYDTSLVQFVRSAARMAHPRRHHRATVLADGRVLITGGENEDGGIDHAEIYNPGTDSFSAVARMIQERYRHTATLLADGRVLVCGGSNVIGPLSSCEVFDPATEVFTSVPSMRVGRFNHTATLLSNGWVLITGGESIDDTSVEIFDPVANDFIKTPNVSEMLLGRDGHSATRPAYAIGRARFTNGSATVTGSDGATNPFGYPSTNWVTAGVSPGDIIVGERQNQPYVITAVDEFELTLGDHPDFDHDDAGYSGPSTENRIIDQDGANAFERYVIYSQDVYIAGGEVTTPNTEVFDFDPNADEWPLASPTDYAFFPAQSSIEGRFGQELTPLADFRLLLVGSRNPTNGRVTTRAGVLSSFTDDPWADAPLDPAGTTVDFPMSFRVTSRGIIVVHEHSARAFFPE